MGTLDIPIKPLITLTSPSSSHPIVIPHTQFHGLPSQCLLPPYRAVLVQNKKDKTKNQETIVAKGVLKSVSGPRIPPGPIPSGVINYVNPYIFTQTPQEDYLSDLLQSP